MNYFLKKVKKYENVCQLPPISATSTSIGCHQEKKGQYSVAVEGSPTIKRRFPQTPARSCRVRRWKGGGKMVVWFWLLVGPSAGKETAAKGGAYCAPFFLSKRS